MVGEWFRKQAVDSHPVRLYNSIYENSLNNNPADGFDGSYPWERSNDVFRSGES